MSTLPPAGMAPMATVTGGMPALPLATVPWLVWTEPTTNVVLLSGTSLKVTPVAAPLPLLTIVTTYSRVSPAEGAPLPSASMKSTSALKAPNTGIALTAVWVWSSSGSIAGSSVSSAGSSLLVTTPWLLTWVTPGGSGSAMMTRKLMSTLPPARMVPM